MSGADALTIFVQVPNLQPGFPVEQGVRVVDEANNQVIVRVELPESQPSDTIDPLPCRVVN